MSLLIVGSVALDDIETSRARVSRILGGAASFSSIAASRFTQTELVGIVGDDFPQSHIDLFKKHGVGLGALEVKEGATFHWAGRYHDDLIHRDTLRTDLGVFEDWQPNIPSALRDIPFVFLANIHPDLQLHVLDQMQNVRLVGCDTMNLWINVAREPLDRIIERSDILLVNDEEARQLTEEISLTKAARVLQSRGPKVIIIKRGEHGASVHGEGRMFYAPAYPIEEVADPTGAGDTFAGALMGYLAEKNSVEFDDVCQGVIQGTVLASFCVEDFSLNRLVTATEKEIGARLERLKEIVRW